MPETSISTEALSQANCDFFELRALAIAAGALLDGCNWETNEKILSAMKVLRLISTMAQKMAEKADCAIPLAGH